MREKDLPFSDRRELLLQRAADMVELRDEVGSFENFTTKKFLILAAANLLISAGELLQPEAGHASATTSKAYYKTRNKLAHEYSNYPLADMWRMLERADQLREEVLERVEPPERAPPEPPRRGFSPY